MVRRFAPSGHIHYMIYAHTRNTMQIKVTHWTTYCWTLDWCRFAWHIPCWSATYMAHCLAASFWTESPMGVKVNLWEQDQIVKLSTAMTHQRMNWSINLINNWSLHPFTVYIVYMPFYVPLTITYNLIKVKMLYSMPYSISDPLFACLR